MEKQRHAPELPPGLALDGPLLDSSLMGLLSARGPDFLGLSHSILEIPIDLFDGASGTRHGNS